MMYAMLQDFLVRSLIGFDQATGAMAIGEGVRVGQRLRFMVRDRDGAMQDLNNHALAIKRRQLQVCPGMTTAAAAGHCLHFGMMSSVWHRLVGSAMVGIAPKVSVPSTSTGTYT